MSDNDDAKNKAAIPKGANQEGAVTIFYASLS